MLQLVRLNKDYIKQLNDMMDEWTNTDEKIVPYTIRKHDYHNFDNYVNNLDDNNKDNHNIVPSTTYFCLDSDRSIFVGAVNIRHYLNDNLLHLGGHIGAGIRPSERNKGYATKMISLALDKCREIGMEKVLMTCNKDNISSAKTIIKNGGVLENEMLDNGLLIQRYWINIDKRVGD